MKINTIIKKSLLVLFDFRFRFFLTVKLNTTSGDFFAGKISGNKRLTIGYDCGILTITY